MKRSGEKEAWHGLSLEGGGVAGPRMLTRRQALGLLGGSLAGFSLLSTGLPAAANAFVDYDVVTLKSLGDKPGPRYLAGDKYTGNVRLVPHTNPPYERTTRWIVKWVDNSGEIYTLQCVGPQRDPYKEKYSYLDGRTHIGDVVLSPHTNPPFTGTLWDIKKVGQVW